MAKGLPGNGTQAEVVVRLAHPFRHGDREVSEVRLRRPTVLDQMSAVEGGGGAAGIELRLVSRLSGLPVEALHGMDFADYIKVQGALRDLVT